MQVILHGPKFEESAVEKICYTTTTLLNRLLQDESASTEQPTRLVKIYQRYSKPVRDEAKPGVGIKRKFEVLVGTTFVYVTLFRRVKSEVQHNFHATQVRKASQMQEQNLPLSRLSHSHDSHNNRHSHNDRLSTKQSILIYPHSNIGGFSVAALSGSGLFFFSLLDTSPRTLIRPSYPKLNTALPSNPSFSVLCLSSPTTTSMTLSRPCTIGKTVSTALY